MHAQTSQVRLPAAAPVETVVEPRVMPTGRFDVPRAAKAIRALLADPNATDQVFVILDALAGRFLERTTAAMKADPVGARLLANPPRLIEKLLFGVSATDPLTFIVIVALLTVVSLLACWIPARRATRVDPLIALRHE